MGKHTFLLISIVVLFLYACGSNKTVSPWSKVAHTSGNITYLKMTGVNLSNSATEVSFHIDVAGDLEMMVSSHAFLNVNGKEYKIKSFGTEMDSAGFKLDKPFKTPADGALDLTLLFDPFHEDVVKFDFVDSVGHLLIKGIYDEGRLPVGLTDTYWRNVETGDWEIGFSEDYVIYDNQIWEIDEQEEQDDVFNIVMECGSKRLNVVVGAQKGGIRIIEIGDAKSVTCQVITTASLPDYPQKDTRKGFPDTGFQLGDSVTIIGWVKDMTLFERYRAGNEFIIHIHPFIQEGPDIYSTYSASLNSEGFFSIKFPLVNTTHALLDWKRSHVQVYLEPGKTYFFLNDFSTGKKLFMGDDVRVQNEIISHSLDFYRSSNYERRQYSKEEALEYIKTLDSEHDMMRSRLKETMEANPNLSQRYIDFYELNCLAQKWHKIFQFLRFNKHDVAVFKEIIPRAEDEMWNKVHPYSIHRDYKFFVRDFWGVRDTYNKHLVRSKRHEILLAAEDSGRIKLDKGIREALESMQREMAKLDTVSSQELLQTFIDSINACDDMKKVSEYCNREWLPKLYVECNYYCHLLPFSGLHYSSTFRELFLADKCCEMIDNFREPINPILMEEVESDIKLQYAKNAVKTRNDKYVKLTEKETPKEIKNSDVVADMSDGEKIFRKLIEPHKGKIILVDVWGIWCSPCKEALSKSQELYERLKDYDIVYMYFANRSPEQAWKNVINEYNVHGDNVEHYNLPSEQQSALEGYLRVAAYPTYRLVDRNGELLEVNASPRDIDAFEQMLKKLQ